MDGKGYGPANLILVPVVDNPNQKPAPPSASGQVDKDGHFTLTTFTAGDGAPAGKYTVTLMPSLAGNPEPPIPSRYTTVRSSGLDVTIEKKPDNNLTVALESKVSGANAAAAATMGVGGMKIKQYPGIEMPSTNLKK
jgi:hypothetical protein